MQVQVLEFGYDSTNPKEIESRINGYLEHHDVSDVQVTESDGQLLVFFFTE